MYSLFRGNATKNKWHLDKLLILLILKTFLNTTRISDLNVKYVDLLNINNLFSQCCFYFLLSLPDLGINFPLVKELSS